MRSRLALSVLALLLLAPLPASAQKPDPVDAGSGKAITGQPPVGVPVLPYVPENFPANTYTNPAPITINDASPATPYPAVINVAGAPTSAFNVRATLTGLSHTFPGDLDILLVGPSGASVILLSDTGGGTDAVNVNITFDDAAPTSVTTVITGTFKPTNTGGGDTWPAPAPVGPYGATMSVFNGTNPNGQWRLFVLDTAALDLGAISGGWSLTIEGPFSQSLTFTSESCGAGGAIDPGETLTASVCVTNQGGTSSGTIVGALQATGGVENPSLPQSYGTIAPAATVCRAFTFNADLGLTCGANVTLTIAYTENGSPIGSAPQTITTGTINPVPQSFSNPANIAVPGAGTSGPAAPYPSTIAVAGVVDPVARVTVSINTASHTFPDDIDVLLVGPTGARIILLSDAGGSNDATGQTWTFDDSAANLVPDSAAIPTGTYRPTNYGTGDTFPAPAPAAPYGSALSAFNGLNPNGNWSLFVVDDVGGDIGAFAGGWTINIYTRSCCTGACTVTPPANVVQGNDLNQCGAVVAYPLPTITGICGQVPCTPAAGSFFPVGTTPVACDPEVAGIPNASFNVTVNDVQPPTVTAPDLIVPNDPGLCSAVVPFSPAAADNCPGVVANCVPPGGSLFPVGVTPVACTATDAAGNVANDAGSITVQDVEVPTITCPADIELELPPGSPGQNVDYDPPVTGDNCPGETYDCQPPSGDFFLAGQTAVNCTALDASGNTATCAFNVILGAVTVLEVPTVSSLGLLALALLLAAAAFVVLRRNG